MNLSENFTLEEMIHSDVAVRKGIDNTPSAEVVANLTEVAGVMEKVRALLGTPLQVTSGYRSPKLNAAVGGSSVSAHMSGEACDFVAPAFGTPKEVAIEIAASDIDFDQLIFEGAWVHISIRGDLRRQILTATFHGGKPLYTHGIA